MYVILICAVLCHLVGLTSAEIYQVHSIAILKIAVTGDIPAKTALITQPSRIEFIYIVIKPVFFNGCANIFH